MLAYCLNDPINCRDQDGFIAATLEGWIAEMWWLCLADTLLPIGEMVFLAGSAFFLVKYIPNPTNSVSDLAEKAAVKYAEKLLDFASTTAPPPPPDKGGKGTRVNSKTVYEKKGKDGFRIDVENPGNRPGQIHVHKSGSKYVYDIAGKCFRVGKSTGPLAPKDVQSILEIPEVVVAIAKALLILGY